MAGHFSRIAKSITLSYDMAMASPLLGHVENLSAIRRHSFFRSRSERRSVHEASTAALSRSGKWFEPKLLRVVGRGLGA